MKILEKEMAEAAEALDFERAALLRDQLFELKAVRRARSDVSSPAGSTARPHQPSTARSGTSSTRPSGAWWRASTSCSAPRSRRWSGDRGLPGRRARRRVRERHRRAPAALKALDAEPGAEVIVPSFTFFATAGAVWNAGLRPVFCDVDPDTFNVTAETLEAAWTDGRWPWCRCTSSVRWRRWRRSWSSPASGARSSWRTRPRRSAPARLPGPRARWGTPGRSASFPPRTWVASATAGWSPPATADLAERVAKLRVHGGRQMYHHEMVGTNSRLDALQAAVLRVKLPHLDAVGGGAARERLPLRRACSPTWPGCSFRASARASCHVYNQFTVRADERDELSEHLAASGVGSGVYYPVPLHLQACFASLGGRAGDLPVTEALCDEVLACPSSPSWAGSVLQRVSEVVRVVLRSEERTPHEDRASSERATWAWSPGACLAEIGKRRGLRGHRRGARSPA